MRLWHGGAPGRRPGDELLPPSTTRIPSLLHAQSYAIGTVRQRSDLVYITSDRDLARAWAAGWVADEGAAPGGGSLYQVQTDHPLVEDEDLPGLGISFQVPSATVLAVYDAHVPPHPRHARAIQRILQQLE